jgi:hypothetical protein
MKQQVNVKFCFKLGKTAAENHEMCMEMNCISYICLQLIEDSKRDMMNWNMMQGLARRQLLDIQIYKSG